jgi:hypothetical protein
MTRDHFNKVMHSPYFQTDHYANESVGSKLEIKIERFFNRIFKGKKKKKK